MGTHSAFGSTTPSFGALDRADQDMLMSSQPVETQDDEQEDHEMAENKEPEDERGPIPKPMNVTETVSKLLSSGTLNVGQNEDLHKHFKTEEWNDHKWALVCDIVFECKHLCSHWL